MRTLSRVANHGVDDLYELYLFGLKHFFTNKMMQLNGRESKLGVVFRNIKLSFFSFAMTSCIQYFSILS